MAYLYDPYADEDEKKTMDVLGEVQPLAEETPAQVGEAPTNGGGQIQAKAVQPQKAAPAKQTSGLHTNIKDYLQANIGEGQRLAGAATKTQETEAGKIRQALQSKEKQFQENIGQAQTKIGEQQAFGQQMVQQAGQAPAAEADISKFRELMTSGPTYEAPSTLNVAPETTRSQAIQNIASRAGTEGGRRAALSQAFGKDAYGTGMQSLDALLLKGDPQAQAQFEQKMQQTAGGLSQDITQTQLAGQQAQEAVALQAQAAKAGLGESLTGEFGSIEGAVQGRMEDVNALSQQMAADIAAGNEINPIAAEALLSTPQGRAAYENFMSVAQQRQDTAIGQVGAQGLGEFTGSWMNPDYVSGRGWSAKERMLKSILDPSAGWSGATGLSQADLDRATALGISVGDISSGLSAVPRTVSGGFATNQDLLGYINQLKGSAESKFSDYGDLSKLGNEELAFLTKGVGGDLSSYLEGQDVAAQQVTTAEEAARYAALEKLAGRAGGIYGAPSESAFDMEQLMKLLNPEENV